MEWPPWANKKPKTDKFFYGEKCNKNKNIFKKIKISL